MPKYIQFSRESECWSTPQALYDRLDSMYHFTLDAAANDENHKCAKYFTKKDDGLAQSWQGESVFCNPPYGRVIRDWVKKAYDESQNGALVVMLLPVRTSVAWFQDYVYPHAKVEFIRGRVKFGNAKNPAPFDSMVCVFGEV